MGEKTGEGKTILIAEDEEALGALLARRLHREGYQTIWAHDGAEALKLAQRARPDLLLLDRMLPYFDGVEICRRLRATPFGRDLPILFLSARGEPEDRISGLESGADDYLPKPFIMEEMLARMNALLRRAKGEAGEELVCGEFTAHFGRHVIMWRGRALALGRIGFALLAFMMRRPGHIFTRDQLLDAVWGAGAILDERTVDVHIGRLRRALKAEGAPQPVETMRGLGYAFRPPEEE